MYERFISHSLIPDNISVGRKQKILQKISCLSKNTSASKFGRKLFILMMCSQKVENMHNTCVLGRNSPLLTFESQNIKHLVSINSFLSPSQHWDHYRKVLLLLIIMTQYYQRMSIFIESPNSVSLISVHSYNLKFDFLYKYNLSFERKIHCSTYNENMTLTYSF